MKTVVENASSTIFAARLPPGIPDRPVYRFNVDQYHRLYDEGIIPLGVELLDGWVAIKDPPEKLWGQFSEHGDEPRDPNIPDFPLYRFSVEDYHTMLDSGILHSGDPVELLEGYLVLKMTKNPPHRIALGSLRDLIDSLLPANWYVDTQEAITLISGEPEPDLTIVAGTRRDYDDRHPGADDLALVIEVADASLSYDRVNKQRMYAEAGIREYWIVNLNDRQIEICTHPSGPKKSPKYAHRQNYVAGAQVPLVIAGQTLGTIAVNDVLP